MPDDPFRARSYQTHVTYHDIDELRYFIQVEFAQYSPNPCRRRFFFHGFRQGVDGPSRAEFEYPEILFSKTSPFLGEENRPTVFQPDSSGDDDQEEQPERKQKDDGDAYNHKVEDSFVSISNDGGFTGSVTLTGFR